MQAERPRRPKRYAGDGEVCATRDTPLDSVLQYGPHSCAMSHSENASGYRPAQPDRSSTVRTGTMLLVVLLWFGVEARAEPEIRIERKENAFYVDARLRVDAHHHIAWQVLTDYNNLARFVPGMQTSEIVSGPGQPLLLRQTGQSGFLVFNVPVDVTVRIDEILLEAVRFQAVAGSLSNKSGEWRLEEQGEATLLLYRASITPGFWVPTLIAAPAMARDIGRKLTGVANEIRRRATDAKSLPKGTSGAKPIVAATASLNQLDDEGVAHVRI